MSTTYKFPDGYKVNLITFAAAYKALMNDKAVYWIDDYSEESLVETTERLEDLAENGIWRFFIEDEI